MLLQDTIPALVNQFPAAAEAWPAIAMAVSIGGVVSGLTGWWKTVLEIRSLRPQQVAHPPPGRRLTEASALLAGEGLGAVVATRRGALPEGRAALFPLPLSTGSEYFVVAACDADCSAMTLELRHPSGTLLSSDDASDGLLTLALVPTEDASYLLSAWMNACADAPCRFGIRVYRR